jgi:hypothetical protein
VRVHFGARWFGEGAFQADPGRVGRADGEVFAGGLAQLLDEFLVVVRVHLEQVPGGPAAPRPISVMIWAATPCMAVHTAAGMEW